MNALQMQARIMGQKREAENLLSQMRTLAKQKGVSSGNFEVIDSKFKSILYGNTAFLPDEMISRLQEEYDMIISGEPKYRPNFAR